MSEETNTGQTVELEGLANTAENQDNEEQRNQDYIPGNKSQDKSSHMKMSPEQAVSGLWNMCFMFIATRRGKHWLLSEEESTELGEATVETLEAFDVNVNVHPAIRLLGASLGVIGLRLMAEQQVIAELEEGASDSGDQ